MLRALFRSALIKIKAAAFLYSLSRTVILSIMFLELIFALDYIFELPSFVRVISMVSLAGYIVYLVIKYISSVVIFRADDKEIALLVEQYRPGLKELLATAVYLNDNPSEGNPFFRKKINQQVDEELSSFKMPAIVNTGKLVRWVGLFFAFTVCALMLIRQYPEHSDVFFGRLLGKNVKWPGSLEFVVTDVNNNAIYVNKGEDLTINVKVLNKFVPRVKIYYWNDEDSITKLMRKSRNDLFTYKISTVLDDFQFYVYSSGAYSETYRVVVLTPPSITRALFDVKYPEYLIKVLGEGKSYENSSNIEVPQYSEVKLSLFLSDTVKSSTAVITKQGSEISLDMEQASELEYTARFKCDFQEGFVSFRLVDSDGVPGELPSTYRIVTIIDNKPALQYVFPKNDEEVSTRCRLPVSFKVIDDFGLRNAELSLKLNGNSLAGEKFELDSRKEAYVDYTLDAEKLGLKEGDIVEVALTALDIKEMEPANKSTLRPLTLRVVAMSSLEQLYQDRVLTLKQRVENVYFREKDLYSKFEAIEEDISTAYDSWINKAKKIAYDQDSLGKILSSIHDDFLLLDKNIAYNRLFDENARNKIKSSIILLDKLVKSPDDGAGSASHLGSITARIFSMIKETNVSLREQSYNELSVDYSKVPEILAQVLSKLEDWITYEAVLSSIKKAQSHVELFRNKVKEQAKCEYCRSGKKCTQHTSE